MTRSRPENRYWFAFNWFFSGVCLVIFIELMNYRVGEIFAAFRVPVLLIGAGMIFFGVVTAIKKRA